MFKGLCVAAVAIFAGFVGYKIIEKKHPELLKDIKGTFSKAGKKVTSVVDDAKSAFREGYSHG
jgi:hypothetical protein